MSVFRGYLLFIDFKSDFVYVQNCKYLGSVPHNKKSFSTHLLQTINNSREPGHILLVKKKILKKFGKAYLGIDLGFYANRSDRRHAQIAATIQQMVLS